MVWSVEMHQQFVQAVNQLGIDSACPKPDHMPWQQQKHPPHAITAMQSPHQLSTR